MLLSLTKITYNSCISIGNTFFLCFFVRGPSPPCWGCPWILLRFVELILFIFGGYCWFIFNKFWGDRCTCCGLLLGECNVEPGDLREGCCCIVVEGWESDVLVLSVFRLLEGLVALEGGPELEGEERSARFRLCYNISYMRK